MKIKGFLVDVSDSPKAELVEVENDSLEQLYKILNCDCIDIVVRSIGGIEFDIVCDDNGLLIDNPRVSANSDIFGSLFGNLFVCHHDYDGNLTSISEEDLKNIQDHMGISIGEDFVKPLLFLDC